MTTQGAKVSLIGPGMTIGMTATVTDDEFTELLDDVDGLSLFKTAEKRQFHSFMGYYTAGGAMFRVRNLHNNQIKALEPLCMAKGVHMTPLMRPVQIVDGDVLEVFATVAGT